jgi:hypothetical protein
MVDDRIDKARAAIGDGHRDDFVIAPARHADEHEKDAAPLARLLRRGSFRTLAEQFEKLDRDAGNAQARYVRTMTFANRAILAAACFTALVLAIAVYWPDQMPPAVRGVMIAASLAAAVLGALAAALQWKAGQGNYLGQWMRKRAGAETVRLAYMNEVTAAKIEEPDAVYGELLKLNYFCRYQLAVQLSYYDKRGADLRRYSDRYLTLAAIAVFVGTLVTAVSTSASIGISQLLPLTALGAVGVALSSYASAQDALLNSRGNAERYEHTYDILLALSGKLGAVEEAVVSGQPDALANFVAAVHEQVSLEHRQFLEIADSQLSAMAKLKEQLEQGARQDQHR